MQNAYENDELRNLFCAKYARTHKNITQHNMTKHKVENWFMWSESFKLIQISIRHSFAVWKKIVVLITTQNNNAGHCFINGGIEKKMRVSIFDFDFVFLSLLLK